eukprot:4110041-Prymnesium_polylepis.1
MVPLRVGVGRACQGGRVRWAGKVPHGTLLVRRGSGCRQNAGGLLPFSTAHASSSRSRRVCCGAGRDAVRAARAARA